MSGNEWVRLVVRGGRAAVCGGLSLLVCCGGVRVLAQGGAAASLEPVVIRVDRNPEQLREPEIPLGGAALRAVTQGLVALEWGRDYRVAGSTLYLSTDYVAALKGRTGLTLRFADGSSRDVSLIVRDTSQAAPGIDFSPPAGTYPSPRRVIVTSPAVDAKIHFTKDGSDPTEKSPSIGYVTVLVDRDLTLKARAFVRGKEPGPVVSASYRIAGTNRTGALPPERLVDATPGGGAYEVYVGSAFYMDEMLDRSQWPYVADTADGLYHRFLGVDPLGDAGKKRLGSFFKGGKAILEGGLRGPQHVRQDLEWVEEVKAMGLRPVASFVNGLNSSPRQDPTDLTVPWQERLAVNREAGIETYTMQAPHRIADEGGWADARFDRTRRWTLMSAGTSADAPTYLFTRRNDAYRQGVYDLIRWTHQNRLKFLFIVSPNEGDDTFLEDTITTVRQLEDNEARPDFYGVTLYGKRPLHLVPEAVVDRTGNRTGASTLTGAAYYLLKHARADGGELDLWLEAGGSAWGKNVPGGGTARADSPVPISSLASSTGALELVVTNRSTWVDFIPVVRVRSDAAGAPPVFQMRGRDISSEVLGQGHLFYRADRLLPGESRRIAVKLPPSAAGGFTVELLPYPGSRFIRDQLQVKP